MPLAPPPIPRSPAIAAPWRALSTLLALLVLGAHLLAYAPAVHARLHTCPDTAGAHSSSGNKAPTTPDHAAHDTCAIALLAQGLTAAPTALVVSSPRLLAAPPALVATARVPYSPRAQRSPPAQAPPAAA